MSQFAFFFVPRHSTLAVPVGGKSPLVMQASIHLDNSIAHRVADAMVMRSDEPKTEIDFLRECGEQVSRLLVFATSSRDESFFLFNELRSKGVVPYQRHEQGFAFATSQVPERIWMLDPRTPEKLEKVICLLVPLIQLDHFVGGPSTYAGALLASGIPFIDRDTPVLNRVDPKVPFAGMERPAHLR